MAAIASAQETRIPFQDSRLTGTNPVLEEGDSAPSGMDQVTSISQLSDVKPTDWAFQALQSLVERYGCIVGYPDKTYRGNRALSRYEFAAGLNACMNRLSELISSSTADLVRKEDLAAVQKLQEQFAAELASLRGRVDALEVRTVTLEKQQFSTTTRLNAEAVVAFTGIATGQNARGGDIPRNTIVGDRIRLNFETSFTGKDLLRTRLQAVNLPAYSGVSTFTPEGDFRFAGGPFAATNNSPFTAGSSNGVAIDQLLYAFPIGESTTIAIDANAGAIDDYTDTINPYFDGDGGSGALTQFGTRNPIMYLLNGTGAGIRQKFGEIVELSLGYLANDAANPDTKGGLFNGPYGASAQLTLRPSKGIAIGFTYIHGYNVAFTANGSTGSNRANLRSVLQINPELPDPLAPFAGLSIPTSSNAYGIEASYQINPNFVINGSVGYTNTRTLSSAGGLLPRGTLEIWNWMVGLAFPDFLKKGSLAGIIVGMEPKVTGVSSALRGAIGRDPDTSIHVEGFYQYQLTDNIAITPGIVWLTAPDHNSANSDIVIGVIRTTFTF
jgi:hypothetical protein